MMSYGGKLGQRTCLIKDTLWVQKMDTWQVTWNERVCGLTGWQVGSQHGKGKSHYVICRKVRQQNPFGESYIVGPEDGYLVDNI